MVSDTYRRGTERAAGGRPPCSARSGPTTRRFDMPVAAVSREGPRSLHVAARLVSIALVVAALWVAQAVLIPIALAAFVTFLMSPLVTRLDRLGLPRVLAVLVVSGAVTGTLTGVGFLVVGQLGQLAEELPEYRDNIRTKLADLR